MYANALLEGRLDPKPSSRHRQEQPAPSIRRAAPSGQLHTASAATSSAQPRVYRAPTRRQAPAGPSGTLHRPSGTLHRESSSDLRTRSRSPGAWSPPPRADRRTGVLARTSTRGGHPVPQGEHAWQPRRVSESYGRSFGLPTVEKPRQRAASPSGRALPGPTHRARSPDWRDQSPGAVPGRERHGGRRAGAARNSFLRPSDGLHAAASQQSDRFPGGETRRWECDRRAVAPPSPPGSAPRARAHGASAARPVERGVLPLASRLREDALLGGPPAASASSPNQASPAGPPPGPGRPREHAASAIPHRIGPQGSAVPGPASVGAGASGHLPDRRAVDGATLPRPPLPAQAIRPLRPDPRDPPCLRRSAPAERRSSPGSVNPLPVSGPPLADAGAGPASARGAQPGDRATGACAASAALKRKLSGAGSGLESASPEGSAGGWDGPSKRLAGGPAAGREGLGGVAPRGEKHSGVEVQKEASAGPVGGCEAGAGAKGQADVEQSDSGHSSSSQVFDGRRKRQRSELAEKASVGPAIGGRERTRRAPSSHEELGKGRAKVLIVLSPPAGPPTALLVPLTCMRSGSCAIFCVLAVPLCVAVGAARCCPVWRALEFVWKALEGGPSKSLWWWWGSVVCCLPQAII